MSILVIRTVIFYVALVLFLRIMGKRQIGELQPTEFAVTLLIADLAAIPMESNGIPIAHGVVPIAVLLILEMLSSFLTLKIRWLRTVISGHPMTVIENGRIRQDIMKKLRFNTDDLCEELRQQGINYIGNVGYAVIETNGKLSVFEKDDDKLFYSVISDGRADKKVMEHLKLSEKELKRIIGMKGYKSEKDVFLMCMNHDKKVFIEGKSH